MGLRNGNFCRCVDERVKQMRTVRLTFFFLREGNDMKNCHLLHLKAIGQIHPKCDLIDCGTLQFNQLQ